MKTKKTIMVCLFALCMCAGYAFGFTVSLPDTGQDLCYDWEHIMCDQWHMVGSNQVCDSPPYCPEEGEDFYGQDGSYTINPPSLTNNNNGTITDNITGLLWEQKGQQNETLTYTYDQAIAYCENLDLGGYTDWRVPTRPEYATIMNFGRVSPALDTSFFPYYTYASTDDIMYWTTSEYYSDPTQVWRIQLAFGLMDTGPKAGDPPKQHKVRCVRGTFENSADYIDNGDSTVTDMTTGLMWEQKTDDGGSRDKDNTYTWKDALAYCANLLLGSYNDWRLPTPKEFERLVDFGRSSPAIDPSMFPQTNNGLYWTGTSCSGCHKIKAFAVNFTDGHLYYGTKYKNGVYDYHYVRAVRNADPDQDGNIDPDDNCPYVANPSQTDTDQDGVGDACDNCPQHASQNQQDADNDGIGDICDNCTDSDGDGRGDPGYPQNVCPEDLCPYDQNNDQDSDGICGDVDNCWAKVNPDQLDTNGNCPAPPYTSDPKCGDACNVCMADFTNDGKVNLTDLGKLKSEFGRTNCNTVPCQADATNDGKVNLTDLGKLKSEFGKTNCFQ
jgi:hypothetical protein